MSSATFPESPASTTGYSTADFALNWHQFGPSPHYPQNRRPPLLCPLRDVDQCLPFLGHVGARAAVEHVEAWAADEHVVAVSAEQVIVAGAAGERVVAGAAVDGDPDQGGQA